MICNREMEMMPQEMLRVLQTQKLQKTITWVYEKSPFYKKKMEQNNLEPADVKTLDDLQKMPFTMKEDLYLNSPFGFLTGPMSGLLRMRNLNEVRPLLRGYTNGDIARNIERATRALVAGGVNMASVMQICNQYTESGIMDLHYAGEVLGAMVVPTSPSRLEEQIEMIAKLGTTVLVTNVQNLLQLLVVAQTMEVDLAKSSIEKIFCVTDCLKNSMEDHLMARYKRKVYNLYAPPELGCTAMFYECEAKQGMHLQEDAYYAEIVNPANGKIVTDGAMGELVITTLATEAMPIIRYRTGQIVAIDRETCKCGRSFARIIAP